MSRHDEKLQFIIQFVLEYAAKHGREACVRSAGELLRLAKRRQAVNLAHCQGCPGVERIPYPRAGELIEDWEVSITRRKAKLDARIAQACAPFGLSHYTGGDPRGAALRVKFPSGTGNCLGTREQWAVPA